MAESFTLFYFNLILRRRRSSRPAPYTRTKLSSADVARPFERSDCLLRHHGTLIRVGEQVLKLGRPKLTAAVWRVGAALATQGLDEREESFVADLIGAQVERTECAQPGQRQRNCRRTLVCDSVTSEVETFEPG